MSAVFTSSCTWLSTDISFKCRYGESKLATFDCYGTLIDWEGGAASFLYSLARRYEQDPPPGRVLRERWEEIQFELLQGDYAPYREILASSLHAWAEERGYRPPDEPTARRSRARWRAGSRSRTPCRRCARRKEAGLRLWIISNTDRAIIEHSLRHWRSSSTA